MKLGLGLSLANVPRSREHTPVSFGLPVPWMMRADAVTDVSGKAAEAANIATGVPNFFAQGTANLRPTIVSNAINGKPALLGDGVDDFLLATYARVAPGTQPFMVWLVARQLSWQNLDFFYNDGGAVIYQTAVTPAVRSYNNVNSGANTAFGVPVPSPYKLILAQWRNATTDYCKIGATFSPGAINTGNAAGGGSISLFANPLGSGCANVEIAEAGCALGVGDAAWVASMATYITARYGASLLT